MPNEVARITVTPMKTHAGASVAITGTDDADMDTDAHEVDLVVGAESVTTITVTAEVGTPTTKDYTVTVTRATSPNATLKDLVLTVGVDNDVVALSPDFASDTTMYDASVANGVDRIDMTATGVAGATVVEVSVNDVVDSSPENVDVNAAGDNEIKVVVRSSDGASMTTYTVTVFKVHLNTDPSLSLGDVIKVEMVDGSATKYEASVDRSVTQVTVEAAAASAITPEDADDAMAGHQVNLMVGITPITVAVGTGDAITTYTLAVTRAASTDATLKSLSLSGVTLSPDFDPMAMTYTGNVGGDVASTTVSAMPTHEMATVSGTGAMNLAGGANAIEVTVTAEDGMTTMTYTVNVARAVVETVPGPTVTRTVTRTVTKTVEVPAPAPAQANVIGMTGSATATEVDGRVLITRHDGGASLMVDLGGFIRDADLGQTYQVVRRADGAIVRQWVSSNSPLVYQIPWAVVNSSFTVPVGVIGSIPLDDMAGAEGQLVRRFDGGDDRIFSYAMGQWRHVPDIPTFQALGFYWCDVTAADASFFDRISMGAAHPASSTPARMDYPSCSTG